MKTSTVNISLGIITLCQMAALLFALGACVAYRHRVERLEEELVILRGELAHRNRLIELRDKELAWFKNMFPANPRSKLTFYTNADGVIYGGMALTATNYVK